LEKNGVGESFMPGIFSIQSMITYFWDFEGTVGIVLKLDSRILRAYEVSTQFSNVLRTQ
jgi:hypothetical protein